MKVDQRVIIRAGEGRVGKDHICVISTAGKGDDHSDDDSCGQRPDLCDHHSRKKRLWREWFVDERSVIITAMMAWMYTVRRLKEVFEVVSDIVFAEHRCRYFSADIIRIQLGIQR